MLKIKRRKVMRADLDKKLLKIQRRIQALSLDAFEIRELIRTIDATPIQKPLTKLDRENLEKENANALRNSGQESSISQGASDGITGGSDVPSDAASTPVLGE